MLRREGETLDVAGWPCYVRTNTRQRLDGETEAENTHGSAQRRTLVVFVSTGPSTLGDQHADKPSAMATTEDRMMTFRLLATGGDLKGFRTLEPIRGIDGTGTTYFFLGLSYSNS